MLREYAKENRQNLTNAEMRLWYFLSDKQLLGYKFRRQHIIGGYIADFYCKEAGIIIEIDGENHAFNKEYDEKRTAYLKGKGYKLLRFWNDEVYHNLEGVLEIISQSLKDNSPKQQNTNYEKNSSPSRGSQNLTTIGSEKFWWGKN